MLAIALLACGAPQPAAGPPVGVLADDADDARVAAVALEGRPPLSLVDRGGDPWPAVALAAFVPGDPAALVGLAEVLERGLARRGFASHVVVFGHGLVVRVADPRLDQVIAAMHAALFEPVRPSAELGAAVRARLSGAPSRQRGHGDAYAACTGELSLAEGGGLDAAAADGAQRIERARQRAATRDAAAFGVVGPRELTGGAAERLRALPAWPAGEPADASPAADVLDVAATLAGGAAPLRLRIAAHVGDPRGAVAAAERLGAEVSPLSAKLSALEVPFEIREVAGVARPGGGCASVVLEPARGAPLEGQAARDALARAASDAVTLARTELVAEGARPPAGIVTRQILGALDARDAAALAAWWSMARRHEGTTPRFAVAADLPAPAPSAEVERLRSALSRATTSTPPPRGYAAGRVEPGQGELWVRVASPCALADEPAHHWGEAAVAAQALAAAQDGVDGVRIDAVVQDGDVGFVAHAHRLLGEAPGDHAARVARAAVRPFWAGPPASEALLLGQLRARDAVEARWGEGSAGLTALAELTMAGHPSLLEPHGAAAAIAGRDAEELVRRMRVLARGPLRVVALVDDESQLETVAREVARHAPLDAATACPERAAPGVRPGNHEGRAPLVKRARVHAVGALAAEDAFAAEVVAALLEDDLLPSRFAERPRVRARAFVVGGAAAPRLVTTLATDTDDVEAVAAELRALLGQLARGEVTDAVLRGALARATEARRSALALPPGRLAALAHGTPLELPTLDVASLRRFLTARLGADRLVWSLVRPE